MNSRKYNPGNKTGHISIIFIAVFAFLILYFPGIKAMAYEDILVQEIAPDKEKEKITALKKQSFSEGDIVAEVNGEVVTNQDLLSGIISFLLCRVILRNIRSE
jgi:hypothetical protein